MVRRFLWIVGLLVLWVASGWTQTYGPGEIEYGGIRLQFAGRLVTAGTCASPTQVAPRVTQIQCKVPEGVAGTVEFTATRTPAGAVNIRAESPSAGWATSLWVQRLGQWVEVNHHDQEEEKPLPGPPVTPPPPTYGPITGKTDGDGRFTGTLAPGVTVTGRLTECTVKPLPNQDFTLTPVPKGKVIASPKDIAGFTFSVPGYEDITVIQFSKFSLFGLTIYLLGDVCLVVAKSPRTDAWPKLTDLGTGSLTGANGELTQITGMLPDGVPLRSALPAADQLLPRISAEEFNVDLYLAGENFPAAPVVFFSPDDGIRVTAVTPLDNSTLLVRCVVLATTRAGPREVILGDKNNLQNSLRTGYELNLYKSLSRAEELELDGRILCNKWNKYKAWKEQNNRQTAARWMITIMNELGMLPPRPAKSPEGREPEVLWEDQLWFGLKEALIAGAEEVAKIPIPLATIDVLHKLYETLAIFFDPQTKGGKDTIIKKLTNRGFSLDEADEILGEVERLHQQIGQELRRHGK